MTNHSVLNDKEIREAICFYMEQKHQKKSEWMKVVITQHVQPPVPGVAAQSIAQKPTYTATIEITD